jgi:predicted alpha-1,2-mannosidase
VVSALLAGPAAPGHGKDDLARWVDPLIGTLGSGFVFPGPAAPYGMVQLSPDTEGYFAYTGYLYSDQFIRGFSHVHIESMGVPEGGNVPFMPTSGPIVTTDAKRYQSRFDHANEEAAPGYYRALLSTYGIDAEVTAGLRVGMHRYTFPPVSQANVLIDAGRQVGGGPDNDVQRTPGSYPASVQVVDARTVTGTANTTLAGVGHYAVHFAARFDRDFASFGGWTSRGGPATPGLGSVNGNGAGSYVSFDATQDQDVLIKVGISYVSVANALENLEAELPAGDFDFDGLRSRTRAAWNDALGTIEVSGGTALDKTSFYTALYHAQHHPNVFNDADGSYLGHDGAVHVIGGTGDPMPAGTTYYANYSLWDTYRGEMQLLALIAPDRFRDMMRSMAAIRLQGGRLPRWALNNRYPDYMVGEPALQTFADGACRGLVPPDALATLYEGARTLALVDRRDPSYLEYGYVPEDIDRGGASSTLEHALGDFALALVADRLGYAGDRDALLGRGRPPGVHRGADSYRNILDPETRFVRPRMKDGSWMDPYFPEAPDLDQAPNGFVEGTGWQYTWLVPHDVRGLFDAMGAPPSSGDDLVRQRLDVFFSTPATATVPAVTPELQQKITLYGIGYAGNQYAPSNEHDLQAPWLYNWTAEPWKTQALQRAYQALFRAAPDGLPGNDDLGSMSAWYVWSALGIYPMIPGAPLYTIGSPVFEQASIAREGGGRFEIEAPGASLLGKYVQSGALNSAALDRTWFTHDALVPGGSLQLEMDVAPNLGWGAASTPRR